MLGKLRGILEDFAAIDLAVASEAEGLFRPFAEWIARLASLARMMWLAFLVVHVLVAVIVGVLLLRTFGLRSLQTIGIESTFSFFAVLIWWMARAYNLLVRLPRILVDLASLAHAVTPIARDAVIKLRDAGRWVAPVITLTAVARVVLLAYRTCEPHSEDAKRMDIDAVIVLTPIGWLLQLLVVLMAVTLWCFSLVMIML